MGKFVKKNIFIDGRTYISHSIHIVNFFFSRVGLSIYALACISHKSQVSRWNDEPCTSVFKRLYTSFKIILHSF